MVQLEKGVNENVRVFSYDDKACVTSSLAAPALLDLRDLETYARAHDRRIKYEKRKQTIASTDPDHYQVRFLCRSLSFLVATERSRPRLPSRRKSQPSRAPPRRRSSPSAPPTRSCPSSRSPTSTTSSPRSRTTARRSTTPTSTTRATWCAASSLLFVLPRAVRARALADERAVPPSLPRSPAARRHVEQQAVRVEHQGGRQGGRARTAAGHRAARPQEGARVHVPGGKVRRHLSSLSSCASLPRGSSSYAPMSLRTGSAAPQRRPTCTRSSTRRRRATCANRRRGARRRSSACGTRARGSCSRRGPSAKSPSRRSTSGASLLALAFSPVGAPLDAAGGADCKLRRRHTARTARSWRTARRT